MTTHTTARARSTSSRRAGYAVTIVVDAVLLYLVNVSPGWQALPFLTDGFAEVLPLVNVSLVAGLLVNAVQLVVDPRWLVASGQAVLAAIALAVSVELLRVFPFDFSTYSFDWELLTRVVLWVAVLGSAIGVVASLVQIGRARVGGTLWQ